MQGNQAIQKHLKNVSNSHIIKTIHQNIFDPVAFAQKEDLLGRTYRFPASRKSAQLHQTAMKFGSSTPYLNDFCPCCMKSTDNLEIGIFHRTYPSNICDLKHNQNQQISRYSHKQQFSLNSGAAMFFFFIKMLIFFLILHFFVVDAYNLITSKNIPHQGQKSWSQYALQNKIYQKQQIQIVQILSLTMIVISMIFFLIATKIKYYIYHKIDMAKQTQDDYAIFVQNIPIIGFKKGDKVRDMKVDYDRELERFFTHKIIDWLEDQSFWVDQQGNQAYPKNSIQYDYVHGLQEIPMDQPPKDIIKSICLCYDVERLQRINKIRQKLMSQQLTSHQNIQKIRQKDKERQEKLKKILQESQISDPNQRMSEIKKRSRRPSIYNNLNQYLQSTKDVQRLDHIPQQIAMCNQSQILVSQEMSTNHAFIHQTTHFVGSAFISFKYQHFRDKILEWAQMNYSTRMQKSREKQFQKYLKEGDHNWFSRRQKNSHLNDSIRKYSEKQNIFSMEFQGNILKISQASNPTEILWENLSITPSQRRTRRNFSLILISLVLLFSFLVILTVNVIAGYTQKQLFSEFQSILSFSIPLITSLIIMGINFALSYLIYEVIIWQRHKTISEAKQSLVKKLVVSQFFNSALINYLVIKVSIWFEIIEFNQQGQMMVNLLVDQITVLLITSGVSGVFFNLLNIPDILRRLTIWWSYTRKQNESKSKQQSTNKSDYYFPTFQILLNKQFEYPEFDIAARYSFYISQIFLASFYGYLIPLAPIIICITFIFHYWIDKINLFKRSSLKYQVGHKLTAKMFKLLSKSIFIYACGMLVFSLETDHQELSPFPFIALIITFIYIVISEILPIRVRRMIFESYNSWEVYSYDQNVQAGKFTNTFWNQNPVTYLLNQNKVTSRNRTRNPGMAGRNFTNTYSHGIHIPNINNLQGINQKSHKNEDYDLDASLSRMQQYGISLPLEQNRKMIKEKIGDSQNTNNKIFNSQNANISGISEIAKKKKNQQSDVLRGQMITQPDQIFSPRDKVQNHHSLTMNPQKMGPEKQRKADSSDKKQKIKNISRNIGKGRAPY